MAGVTFKIKQFVPNNDLYQVEEVDKTYNSLADLVNELSVNLIEISKLNNKRNGFLTKLKKINPFKNNDQQNLNNLVSDLEYYIRWYNYAQMVKQDVQVFSPENNILISTFNQHRAKFNELSSRAGNDISKKIDLINNKIETLSQQIALNSIVLARTNKLTSRVAGQEWFINPVFDTTDTAPRTPATTTAPRTPAPVTTPTPAPAPAPKPVEPPKPQPRPGEVTVDDQGNVVLLAS